MTVRAAMRCVVGLNPSLLARTGQSGAPDVGVAAMSASLVIQGQAWRMRCAASVQVDPRTRLEARVRVGRPTGCPMPAPTHPTLALTASQEGQMDGIPHAFHNAETSREPKSIPPTHNPATTNCEPGEGKRRALMLGRERPITSCVVFTTCLGKPFVKLLPKWGLVNLEDSLFRKIKNGGPNIDKFKEISLFGTVLLDHAGLGKFPRILIPGSPGSSSFQSFPLPLPLPLGQPIPPTPTPGLTPAPTYNK